MSGTVEKIHRTFPKSVQPGIPKLPPVKPGWKRYTFGDLFDVVQRPVKMSDTQEYDLVTVKRSRGGIEKRSRLFGSQIAVKNQFVLEELDFLISKRQIVHGACAIVPKSFSGSIVSNEYSVLRCKSEFDLQFIGYLSHSIYFQQTCFHSSIGVHVEKMIFKLDEWFKWPINLPSLPEQKKIAAFLGVVDDKLASLKAKRDLLSDYKRGVMQKLFSQELRFTKPNGQPFPDWEEKRLGELGNFVGGGTPDTDNAEYWTGEIPWISSSDILEGKITSPKITRGISSLGLSSTPTKLVSKNSILFVTRVGVGKLCVSEEELCTSQDFTNFTPRKENPHFLAYWFLDRQKALLRLRQGTSIQGITTHDLKSILIPVPHPDEQKLIANALSALDAKIAAVSDQVAQMETFKKGLLQQMFV